MSSPFAVFLEGLGLGASLIIAIGAQNAHVLRTGLRGDHLFLTVATCVVCDALLIAAGVAGMGAAIAQTPSLLAVARWGGAAFLAWHGARALRAAFGTQGLEPRAAGKTGRGAWQAWAAILGLTLLNPHVYLDTVVLLGAVGGRHPPGLRSAFGAGAASASLLWFAGLGYGARRLAPLFARPAAWRMLDGLVCAVMWSIALGLLLA